MTDVSSCMSDDICLLVVIMSDAKTQPLASHECSSFS